PAVRAAPAHSLRAGAARAAGGIHCAFAGRGSPNRQSAHGLIGGHSPTCRRNWQYHRPQPASRLSGPINAKLCAPRPIGPTDSSMQPLLIHGKRSRYLTLVAMAVGVIGTGVVLGIQGGGLRLYGWLLVVVQCLSLPNLVRLALLKGPRLVIDDDGIHDHLLRVGTIPWSEIVGAKMRTVNSFCFIALELREPELWLRRMSPLRRWLMSRNRSAGFGMLSLNLNATDGDPVQVLRLIQQRCGESASHPAASSSPPPLPPADIRIPIRYSRRFSLSISANNSFGLSGPGEIEFLDGRVLLRGLRNRFFGLGRWFSYDFHRTATTNLMHSGRMLHFDIEPPGAPPQVVTIWTKDEDTARRIASALPSRASEGMSLVASEIHKFQRRVDTTG